MTAFKKIAKNLQLSLKTLVGLGVFSVLLISTGCNGNKNEDNDDPVNESAIGVHENNSTVAGYISFVRDEQNKMTLDHAYTNKALLDLVSATNAMADEIGFSIKGDLDQAKAYADAITKDPYDTSHADNIRKATDILSNTLQNMQQAKYPELSNEVSELKNAAASINPDVLTLDQKDAIKSFFSKAADILGKMN